MLNHIDLMGRLTRDPELRRTGSGTAVANFTIAVDRDFKSQSGEKETDFIDCVAWRSTAEFVSKYFKKGSMAVVSGRLTIRVWDDKDGNKRRTAEIVADNIYFGRSNREAESGTTAGEYTGGGYTQGESSFPETEAMLARYGAGGGDFAVLDGKDDNLPF